MSIAASLREFHAVMSVPTLEVPTVPSTARIQLRARILAEEAVLEHLAAIGCAPELVREARVAIERAISTASADRTDIILVADAMADAIYVAEGTNLEYGIPGEAVFREVHAANMRKAGGPRWADGKVMKPAGWKPPDVAGVLRAHGWKGR